MSSSDSPHYRPTPDQKKDTIVELAGTGGNFKILPIALDVTWGNDPRYWEKPKDKDAPLTLSQVSWLEVTGTIPKDRLKSGTKYRVSFMMSLKQDAFGWGGCPVYLTVKDHNGKYLWKNAEISQLSKDATKPDAVPQNRNLIFSTPTDREVPDYFFGLYEIWRGRWKGGLQIHGVVVEKVVD